TSGNYFLKVQAGNPIPGDGFEPGVTDLVGNKLDGEFNGVFPSGDGDPPTPTNPSGRSANEDFLQPLGNLQLLAPIIAVVNLVPPSDTGIQGDSNTNINTPIFVGVVAANFPGTVSGLTVYYQFNALPPHNGTNDLAPQNGRGYMGSPDGSVTTDANGV